MNRGSAHPRADPAGRSGRRGRRPLLRRALLRLVLAGGMALAVPAGAQQGSGPLYGPVQPADTLWVLALRFRGEADVTPQQAMIAILRANPEAFTEGNVNALRTGANLRVPSASEMAAITPGEAAAEFARHDEAWRNRQQTGSAAPAPAPGAPAAARPAGAPAAPAATPPPSPPAGTAEEEADDAPDALAEARAEAAELRERLAERDTEIENLLAQLFAARRELDRLREAGAELPGGSGLEAGADAQDPAEAQGGPPARQLPVSPLVLGSALIVLLVLVVVVTLIRRRETPDPSRAEDDDLYGEEHEDDDEEYIGGEDDEIHRGEEGEEGEEGDPDGEEEGEVRADGEVPGEEGKAEPDGGEEPGAGGGDGAPPLRRMRSWRMAPAAAGAGTAAAEAAPVDGAAPSFPEHEDVDLPFGLDLDEGEEHGETAPAGAFRGGPELPDPEADPGSDRHVEVGELDDLDLGTDPDPTSFGGLPDAPGSEDGLGPREASFSDLPADADAGDEDGRGPGTAGLSDLSGLPGDAEGAGGRPAGGRRRGTPAFGTRE